MTTFMLLGLNLRTCLTPWNDLTSSEFYTLVTDLITKVLHSEGDDKDTKIPRSEVICYGLGNFSECIIARYQLCLLMALREHLKIVASDCHLYDPKFRAGEIDILSEMGFRVIDKNEEGKRPCAVDTKTLFYMPHCGKSLCNNLLWANWDRQRLANMVVIGNSFSSILDNTPGRLLEETGGYIQRLHPYCTEVPLPTTFKFTDIFNDTSIHSFPANKLQNAPEELWDSPSEPHYEDDDVEFISNKLPT
ncbi:SRR1-like protein isoform X2 [Mizuhopecten yessoensis]|uniref:SRR1-like protein isoform X2 n=1 Tax=Mizuhopecten yessoensis TaxID=6573 RepID=UPI000B45813F|nr:SRR1-like protein isoform X2 [Mizuhopecten yessoensis]